MHLARVLALSEGIAQINTSERLHAAAATNALSDEMGANLIDALEFIASLRIRHQADQIARRTPGQPDHSAGVGGQVLHLDACRLRAEEHRPNNLAQLQRMPLLYLWMGDHPPCRTG